MRSLITALVIAALLGAASEIYMYRLEKASWELTAINGEISEAVSEEDYGAAKEAIDRLNARMDDAEMFFGAMGDHEEMDMINMNIAELRGYIDAERGGDAASKCLVLSYLFGHLPENSRLKLQNIF